MYYVLVLILGWSAPSLTVVDNVPGIENCKAMGEDFLKNHGSPFHARYLCIERYRH